MIVGVRSFGGTEEAFYWTPAGQIQPVPLPDNPGSSTARSVSGSGQIIVGSARLGGLEWKAFRWDRNQASAIYLSRQRERSRHRRLRRERRWARRSPFLGGRTALPSVDIALAAGVLPPSWEPFRAYGVDYTGNAICGYGQATSGKLEGYVLIMDATLE